MSKAIDVCFTKCSSFSIESQTIAIANDLQLPLTEKLRDGRKPWDEMILPLYMQPCRNVPRPGEL